MHTSGNINDNLPLPIIHVGEGASLLASPAQLIDHRAIDWQQVVHARYWMGQTFEYTYPGPIRDLRQRLIVIPPDQHADQRLLAFTLQASSPLATQTVEFDSFGNRVIRFNIPYVDERVTFDMKVVIERDIASHLAAYVAADEVARYRQPTHLTTPDDAIEALARQFRQEYVEPERMADALNTWIYSNMRYGRGATNVFTTAAEALLLGQGLCQDYAHIMLAICRAAGLAARYVSGHLLGEGRSHAWIEVLLPAEDGPESDNYHRAVAFDPTNHRRTTPAYLTIAVGRDYSDVSPTAGSFTAPYPGQLHATKRAGITQLELRHSA